MKTTSTTPSTTLSGPVTRIDIDTAASPTYVSCEVQGKQVTLDLSKPYGQVAFSIAMYSFQNKHAIVVSDYKTLPSSPWN